MRSDEWRSLGRLVTRAVVQTVDRVDEVQGATADRWFAAASPLGRPVQLVYDGIGAVAYGSTGGIATVDCTTSEVLATVAGGDGRERSAAIALDVVNSAIGDRPHLERDPLALPAALRVAGRDVEPTPAGLAVAYPNATGRIAVFVHGLGETEEAWRLGSRRHYGDTTTHGTRLARDLGHTPVYVRYNTGRPLADSAADLDDLLELLAVAWPVAIDEFALIGHSMGGLVARAAHLSASQRRATCP